MKIGFVSPDHLVSWHGTTRLIDRFAEEMSSRGYKVAIIATPGVVSEKIPVSAREYPHELIEVDYKNVSKHDVAREKIAASGIDICFASVGNNLILYLPSLFRGSGIPFIFGDPSDPRVRTFATWQPYESYGSLACADAIQTLLPEFIPFYPKALRTRITSFGIPAPSAADVDFEARRGKKNREIIAVGRFNEAAKRFSLLIKAFAAINGDFPDWRLKMVGDGPYWDVYIEMAKMLGISNRVDFVGAVLDTGVHYAGADIFCLPSFFEGFPLVLGEAAAYSLPIAGYRFCTALDSFVTPERGLLAEETTHEALADVLSKLMLASPLEREKMGINAREAYQARYGGGKVYDEFENLLHKTLERTKNAGQTVLDRILGDWGGKMLKHIGPEWKGLEPDSEVWSEDLLDGAAAEIASRENPMLSSEAVGEAEVARLRSELVRLQTDYNALETKYSKLLGQFKQGAGKKRKR